MSPGVLIMAKAPRAGQVKTRLEPLLGPAGCAELQRALIRHTVAWVRTLGAPAWLAYAPRDAAPELAELVGDDSRLLPQEDGDLGRRMRAAALAVSAEHGGPLAVIGTDAPRLGPTHVDAAARALAAGHDACVVPALDGGYSMIALARASVPAFRIPADAWGGRHVLRLTVGALRDAGLHVTCLDPLGDLDTPADAAALRADPTCPTAIREALRPRMAA